ncbi:MAG: hypothetical protein U5M51_16580 [Emticicia sp.]|nr:hypothetical protein [Emticicia sp.]
MNLQDLIQSCKTGNRKAQKTLFDGFSKTFLRLSFRYLNDRQYAEDACLEAFTLIFENLQKFDYQSDSTNRGLDETNCGESIIEDFTEN